MKKISEERGKYLTFKDYELDNDFECKQLIFKLISLGYDIINIEVEETVEQDMQIVDGNYRVKDFLDKYDLIAKYEIDKISITLDYYGQILELTTRLKGKTINLSSENQTLELEDILQAEKKNFSR